MYRVHKILLPFDFSKYSQAALEKACDLAQQFEAELTLLHVVGEGSDEALRTVRENLQRVIPAPLKLKLNPRFLATSGTAHRQILRRADEDETDLIVMGTHGRTGLAHLAMGSVAERVLRAANCPVLIVRHPDQQLDLQHSAAKLLRRAFGEQLEGTMHEGRARLKGRLAQELEISEQLADHVVTQLETTGVLRWSVRDEQENQPSDQAEDQAKGQWWIDPAAIAADGPPRLAVSAGSAIAPAVDLIERALTVRATDIHIDPCEDDQYRVQFRIDGRLERYCELDNEVADHLIHQFKTLGNLDIAEPFRPKEGRLRLPSPLSRDLEVRLTSAPVAGGEAAALRLFSSKNVFYSLHKLGMSEPSLEAVQQMLKRGAGIVLVTGQTGAGKTTTVYSMLEVLGTDERKIVAIEDPVEYPVSFVRQMEVDARHGLTMTAGLRTLLRMDPDVIFVGEIRDSEAAGIAMRAASSGRYVFSTLHTRDASATVTALRDLGIDNRSLAANLTGIISQRLVRRLCRGCRQASELTTEDQAFFRLHQVAPPARVFRPQGCDDCRASGYLGRVGVFEAVLVQDSLREAIFRGASEDELRRNIRSESALSLTSDGLAKVSNGLTGMSEVLEMRWL